MTTDADKIDNLLAQRRELMDKIEEQIDERGRIIERIQSAPDTPIARLRELHRRCSCWGENCGGVRPNVDANSHCAKCIVTWPCDTIAALDALDALLVVSPADLEAFALSTQSIIRHAEGKDTEIRALQARIDAATVLIRNMIAQHDRVHKVWDGLDEGPCPETAPFRAWLSQGGPR